MVLNNVPFRKMIKCTGETIPRREVEITAEVRGKIKAIYIGDNDFVKKGKLLFEIENPDIEQDYKRGLSRITQSAINFVLEFNHPDSLDSKTGKFMSDLKILDFSGATNYDLERIDNFLREHRSLFVTSSFSGFYNDLIDFKQQRSRMQNRKCYAPFSGQVVNLNIQRYQNVSPDQACLTLLDRSRMKLRMKVLEEFRHQIREGDSVAITFPAIPGTTFSTVIASISPVIDHLQKVFAVNCYLENEADLICAGMFPFCSIYSGRRDSCLVIPKSALLFAHDHPALFRTRGNRAEYVRVKLGGENLDQVQVLEGLHEGDTIIVQGHSTLTTDATVKIQTIKNGDDG